MAESTRFKYTDVVSIMRSNACPCWKLSIKEGMLMSSPIGSFLPVAKNKQNAEEDFSDSEAKQLMEESMTRLDQHIIAYGQNPKVTFLITYNKTTKGNDWKGPVPFYNDNADEDTPTPTNQSFNGLNGLPGLGAMDQFQTLLGIQEKKNELALDKRDFEYEKKQAWKEIEDEKKRLKGLESEMKEALIAYNSQSGRTKKGLELYLEGVIEKFLPSDDGDTLKGTKTERETEAQTPQEQAIESIAKNIDENVSEIDHIIAIGVVVQKCIESPDSCNKIKRELLMSVA